MKIVVIGGTGLIGSKVVTNLTEQGQAVVTGVDHVIIDGPPTMAPLVVV